MLLVQSPQPFLVIAIILIVVMGALLYMQKTESDRKIAELENKLRYAKIINESEIDTKTVQVGNKVRIKDLEFDEEFEYTIVGSTEVDLAQNRISNESPIGSALMGAKKNQVVEVSLPDDEVAKYKVIAIEKSK